MTIHLGTSGWSYPGWSGLFYPQDLPSKDWLNFYSQHFSTVEINMTFYRFPKPETLTSWMDKTPSHFLFTLKANRQITHLKKIKDVQHEVRYFYILANSLKEKLGCILFQLPPSIRFDLPHLEGFLATLSPEYRNVIEFRHESMSQNSFQRRQSLNGVRSSFRLCFNRKNFQGFDLVRIFRYDIRE